MLRFVYTILSWLMAAWFIMIFAGIIASQHHLYHIGYGETSLGLLIISNIVGYVTLAFRAVMETEF